MRDIMRHRVLIEQVLGGHIYIISKNKFSGEICKSVDSLCIYAIVFSWDIDIIKS